MILNVVAGARLGWSKCVANCHWDFHKIATISKAHKGWWSKMSIERPLCGGKCLAFVRGQRSSLADWLTGATQMHQSQVAKWLVSVFSPLFTSTALYSFVCNANPRRLTG